MNRAELVRTLAGFLVATLILAGLLVLVGTRDVVTALTGANPLLVAVAMFLMLLWNVSWGLSLWQIFETQDMNVAVPKAVLLQAAAAFSNNITPLGQAGGEPVSAMIIAKSTDTDFEVSLASVASFDALHLIPSLIYAASGAIYLLTVTSVGDRRIEFLTAGILVAAVGIPTLGYVIWQYRQPIGRRLRDGIVRVVRGLTGVIPGVSTPDGDAVLRSLTDFSTAIERVAEDRRRLALAVGFSTLGSLCQAIALLVIFEALAAPIPVWVPFVVNPIAATSGGVPTPGGLGGTEAVSITLLTLLTAVSAPTITAAVAIHSTGGFLLTTGVGGIAVSILGVRTVG